MADRVTIPLLGALIPDGVRAPTIFAVEFDPESQWFAVATTIVAHSIRNNQYVGCLALGRPREDIERDLSTLGIDAAAAYKSGRFTMDDLYSARLAGGRLETSTTQSGFIEPIVGGLRIRSLRVSDLSTEWLKLSKYGPQPYDIIETWPPGALALIDSVSPMLRFNEEKALAEWVENRVFPNERRAKRITFIGVVRGIHTEWLYKSLEAASDGVIDVRMMERDDETKDFLRIRSLKGQPRDARWHELSVKSNGEASLEA